MKRERNASLLARGVLSGAVWCAGWLAAVRCSWIPGDFDWTWECAVPILAGVLCGLALAGPGWGWAWLISLPAGLLGVLALGRADVLTKILNQMYPDYGRMSAGGGFGVMLVSALYGGITGVLGPLSAWTASEWLAWRRSRRKGADGTCTT